MDLIVCNKQILSGRVPNAECNILVNTEGLMSGYLLRYPTLKRLRVLLLRVDDTFLHLSLVRMTLSLPPLPRLMK